MCVGLSKGRGFRQVRKKIKIEFMIIKRCVLSIVVVVAFTSAGASIANEARVIGGTSMLIEDAPSIVGLLNADTLAATGAHYLAQFCAGTLVADNWVLTAAHCVVRFSIVTDPDDIKVLVNTSDLNNPIGDDLDVIEIIVHPDYFTTLGSDIALLRLGSVAGASVAPLVDVALETNDVLQIAGWGATQFTIEEGSFNFPNQLHGTQVNALIQQSCNQLPAYRGEIDESMVCAGFPAGGRDTCQGDSGGPLYLPRHDGQLAVAGITSWGVGCALAVTPGVYTDVLFFSDWIRSIIRDPPVTIAINSEEEPSTQMINLPVQVSTNEASDITAVSTTASSMNNSRGGSVGGWMLALLTSAAMFSASARSRHSTNR